MPHDKSQDISTVTALNERVYVKPELILLDGDEGDGKVNSPNELPNGAFQNGAFVSVGPS